MRTRERDQLSALLAAVDPASAHGWSETLLGRYNSLSALLRAFGEGEAPCDVPAAIATHLHHVANTHALALHGAALMGPRFGSLETLTPLLRQQMAHLARETFRVFFLDGGNRLLADRTMWTGTVDAVQIHPREVVREALALGATALIAAHNHPSGSARPTADDLIATERLVRACAALGITVHDHIIVARGGVFSMARAKLPALCGAVA